MDIIHLPWKSIREQIHQRYLSPYLFVMLFSETVIFSIVQPTLKNFE